MKNSFKTLDKSKKVLLVVLLITIALVICIYAVGKLSQVINESNLGSEAARPTGIQLLDIAYNAFGTRFGQQLMIFVVVTGILCIGFLVLKSKMQKDVLVDERGVVFANEGTYGTAGWLTEKEAKAKIEVCPVEKATGNILGQITEGGKVVAVPQNTNLNLNQICLGSPGKGKSYGYVRSAMLQSIMRGDSVVVTDPSGELYESMSETFREHGYIVKLFNTVEPKLSDAWDCMAEIFDPATGCLDDIRLADFVSTLIDNTTRGGNDEFWGLGESNFFQAVTAYCAWNREHSLRATYKKEFQMLVPAVLELGDDELKVLNDRIDDVDSTIVEIENILLHLYFFLGKSEEDAYGKLEYLQNQSSQCNIAKVYFLIVNTRVAEFEDMFKPIPISHPASIAWSIFKGGKEGVRENFVQGLAIRLQLFQMRDIRRIITNRDIDLSLPGEKRCAYFCKISDKTSTMAPITSLFFSFLFKNLSDAADRLGPENRLFVNVILDEFANIGTGRHVPA